MPKDRKAEIEPYVRFINKWHEGTVSEKKVLKHEDGSPTTVYSIGIPLNGKIYLVPGYLRDGKLLSAGQAYNYWKDKIPALEKAGDIVGVPDDYIGDMKDHPANVISRENKIYNADLYDPAKVPEDAYGYIWK